MTLLSIDPGLSIGWAKFKDNLLYKWGIEKIDDNRVWPFPVKQTTNIDEVVYERFFVTQPFQDTRTAEVIGVIKYLCVEKGIPISHQEPSMLQFVLSRFLHNKQVDYSTYSSHALSAIMHGIGYLYLKGEDVIPIVNQITKERINEL